MSNSSEQSIKDFWKRFDHQMDLLSLSQKDLWDKIAVVQNTASGWKHKLRYPPVDVCLLISEELGVSIRYLVTGIETDLDDEYYPANRKSYLAMAEKSEPRTIPSDVLHALTYCSDKQLRSVKKMLGLDDSEF